MILAFAILLLSTGFNPDTQTPSYVEIKTADLPMVQCLREAYELQHNHSLYKLICTPITGDNNTHRAN